MNGPGYKREVLSPPPPIVPASTSVAAVVGPTPGAEPGGPVEIAGPVAVGSLEQLDEVLAGAQGSPLAAQARAFFDEGGRRLFVTRTLDESPEAFGEAFAALASLGAGGPDLIFLASGAPATGIDGATIATAASWCERHRRFLIVDPDPSWTSVEKALTGHAALPTRSANAALYFPRLLLPGAVDDGALAPSGAIAGVYARTDRDRGVWKAPAGTESSLQGEPSVRLTHEDGERLNAEAINGLRVLPGAGTVVWGGRTMAGGAASGSEWLYVPVRRTALFLEKSVYDGTDWAVFEPNDEPLWARLRRSIDTFLNDLFRQGAFSGSKPSEAYFVRVDRTTMSEADIEAGEVRVQIGFAPVRPAEFVIIRIGLRAQPAAD